MNEVRCSLRECGNPLLGHAVMVARDHEPIDFEAGGMTPYKGLNLETGAITSWAMLHPNCFTTVYEEILRQGGMAVFTIAMGPIGDLREALEMF